MTVLLQLAVFKQMQHLASLSANTSYELKTDSMHRHPQTLCYKSGLTPHTDTHTLLQVKTDSTHRHSQTLSDTPQQTYRVWAATQTVQFTVDVSIMSQD